MEFGGYIELGKEDIIDPEPMPIEELFKIITES